MTNYLNQLNQIKCFVFDVDGVMTDGRVLALESGEQARSFLVKDGYAIERALKAGYHIAIISGGNQEGVRRRLEFLKIKHIHLGAKDKKTNFHALLEKLNLNSSEVLYMGDDWPDYEVMQLAGLPCCPHDAVDEVKAVSKYVSPKNGGDGCVRDVIEKVLKAQGKFEFNGELNINN